MPDNFASNGYFCNSHNVQIMQFASHMKHYVTGTLL